MDPASCQKKNICDELDELDQKIEELTQTETNRKQDKIKLYHKYNETKDAAQLILGTLAEKEGLSIKELYKNMTIDFDK
ncbi:CLUMA_CG004096, isoform A [Clunio marinus]|uniref:DNA repair protein SWI5 homolog n=1 Tax=Clunio marinus TaxID=568069 RepID=A0A1J1HW90_9DIPT|nr:CLUMA_CG004096, isoform A [Clunio marinus]